MSKYYNPNRSSEWNYGGEKWKLSRSKIALFLKCPKCFYIDNKLGTKRVPPYPYKINDAVDELLKKEFDIHRAENKRHPLQKKYGIDARPVAHEELDIWRANFEGIQYEHEKTGMTITGALDDLWINPKGEYIVVDFKATSLNEEITELNKDHHEDYKRQLEIYQWLLRRRDLKVSNTSYIIYANANTDLESFDGKIEFDLTLIPHKGDDGWVEKTIMDIHKCLKQDTVPEANKDCDFCRYRETVERKLTNIPH